MIDSDIAYKALTSRDPRFDGVFFVGVLSTGIYCRPVCPARSPSAANCQFFESAEAAEKMSFRPCLRCRPEMAPGKAPMDNAHRIAELIIQRVNEQAMGRESKLEELALYFNISSRQLRRIVSSELGVSPVELIQTRRLLLAKQLLTETVLPVSRIAFAAGFSSIRRFNDAFRCRYRMAPGELRKHLKGKGAALGDGDTSTLRLGYRPPYDWSAILDFLRGRMIESVEFVTDEQYLRTVQLGQYKGWIRVGNVAAKNALSVEFSNTLTPVLPTLLGKLRHLFDLTARPDLINEHLCYDQLLCDSVNQHPGLRVPGAFDGFEMVVRAILGQQITVKAATTIACRFARQFGQEIITPFSQLSRLTPAAEVVAISDVDEIAGLGIVSTRARSIIGVAQAYESGDLHLDAGHDPDLTVKKLLDIPGIGPWTAQYIAMRALRWPDSFPCEDIVLRKMMGNRTAKQTDERSQAWRPWRSYAVMHLWKMST